jgi:tetratricopeptide (TPR) repeat protein
MRSTCKCGATTLAVAVGVCLGAATPARAGAVLPAAGEIEGTAVTQWGSYLAAELFLKRAIAVEEKALGPDHLGLAAMLDKLATLYQATGRPSAAEPLLKRAIAIDEKALGPEHPDLAGRLNNLAVLYWATGRLAAAEPLFARALAILEERLPLDHPVLAAIRENYTNLLGQLGYGGVELRIQAEAIL